MDFQKRTIANGQTRLVSSNFQEPSARGSFPKNGFRLNYLVLLV
jgi:hypothetical protein